MKEIEPRKISAVIFIFIIIVYFLFYYHPEKKSEDCMKKIIASHYEAEQYDHWIWMKRGDRYYINGLTKKED